MNGDNPLNYLHSSSKLSDTIPELASTANLQWVPWDIIDEIGIHLDLRSIHIASATCRYLYLGLMNRRQKKEMIPWRISIEYHFSDFDYYVHSIWIRIGWFDNRSEDESCDFCTDQRWTGSEFSDSLVVKNPRYHDLRYSDIKRSNISLIKPIYNSDIKTVTTTGMGGSILSRILRNGPIIPIWFKVDTISKIIIPHCIGNKLSPVSVPDRGHYYFDESRLLIGSLIETSSEYYLDHHRLHRSLLIIKDGNPNQQIISGEIQLFEGISTSHLFSDPEDILESSFLLTDEDDEDDLNEGYDLDPSHYDILSGDETNDVELYDNEAFYDENLPDCSDIGSPPNNTSDTDLSVSINNIEDRNDRASSMIKRKSCDDLRPDQLFEPRKRIRMEPYYNENTFF